MKIMKKTSLLILEKQEVLSKLSEFFKKNQSDIKVDLLLQKINDYLEENPLAEYTITEIPYCVTYSKKLYNLSNLSENTKLTLYGLLCDLLKEIRGSLKSLNIPQYRYSVFFSFDKKGLSINLKERKNARYSTDRLR